MFIVFPSIKLQSLLCMYKGVGDMHLYDIFLTLNIIQDFFSYYYTLNSLSLFLLAEGVQ